MSQIVYILWLACCCHYIMHNAWIIIVPTIVILIVLYLFFSYYRSGFWDIVIYRLMWNVVVVVLNVEVALMLFTLWDIWWRNVFVVLHPLFYIHVMLLIVAIVSFSFFFFAIHHFSFISCHRLCINVAIFSFSFISCYWLFRRHSSPLFLIHLVLLIVAEIYQSSAFHSSHFTDCCKDVASHHFKFISCYRFWPRDVAILFFSFISCYWLLQRCSNPLLLFHLMLLVVSEM